MSQEKSVRFYVEMSESQALAYAQFLKRVTFNDYRSCAVDKDETYTMIDGGEKIQEALAEQGFAPR